MELAELKRIFDDTDYVRRSGTPGEKQAAEYLLGRCEALGVKAWLEEFPVPMGEIEAAEVLADGKSVPCKGLSCCGSGSAERSFTTCRGWTRFPSPGRRTRSCWWTTWG